MLWYYANQGRQSLPVEEAELETLVRSGAVRPDTLVWHEGMDNWKPYGDLRPMSPPQMPSVAVGPGTGYCGECGRVFPLTELVTLGTVNICASCKPIHLQRLREGGHALGMVRYAGFWVRFVASLIDSMALSVAGWIVQIPLLFLIPLGLQPNQDPTALLVPRTLAILGISTLLNVAVAVTYHAYFLSTRGATPGKMALSLKVVRADGSGISRGLGAGRYFAMWVSSLTLMIGFIMAGFDDEKRALHDRICDTRVIHAN